VHGKDPVNLSLKYSILIKNLLDYDPDFPTELGMMTTRRAELLGLQNVFNLINKTQLTKHANPAHQKTLKLKLNNS
jgi:hypothetical protein